MKVLVCGGRDYTDIEYATGLLDHIHAQTPITRIIQGGASGADLLARNWAIRRGVDTATFWAAWKEEGRSAGPKRNQRMIDEGEPDMVVAFPGGRGTADMVRRAKTAAIKLIEVTP